MEEDIVYSLSENPIPIDKIPEYPTYKLKTSTGKEWTYDLVEEANGFLSVKRRRSEEGEILRQSDLRYIADWNDNLLYRANIIRNAKDNPAYQQLQIEFCRSNILYFANTFCWTFDTRLDNATVPMTTYPFQDDMLTWSLKLIRDKETGLIEKSRDMGATWMMELVAVYMTIFFSGNTDYQMSLREEDVDDRTDDSLLGKYRFIVRNLPEWMRGGWKEKSADDTKMTIKIPQTGSKIKGQLTMGTSGRGGRATRAFNDEFAFVEDADKVMKSLGALSPSGLYLSTPNGMGNEFYHMAQRPGVLKKTLHWSLHPMKNPEWARKERSRVIYNDERWSQEHEICYETSTQGRVYSEFVSFTASDNDWCHIQTDPFYEYDPNYDVYVGLDFGMADPTSAVFAQIKPAPPHFFNYTRKTLVFIDEYEEANKVVDEWADVFKKRQLEKKYQYNDFVGDFRSGNQRDSTGKTWIYYLGQHGIDVKGKYNTEQAPIMEVKKLLRTPGAFAINPHKCPNLVKAFQNWAYPVDRLTRLVKTGSKPNHDNWSHSMKATCYLVDYLMDKEKTQERKKLARPDWNYKVINRVGL